ncbi:MAG: hypothetical protein U0354_07900 [Candidatus Sericytochromatia bacterium]
MKRRKSLTLLAISSLFFNACQNNIINSPIENNNEQINANAVVDARDIKELKNLKSTISNSDSGIVVATLSGGEIYDGEKVNKPLKQKLYFDFQDVTNSSEIEFGVKDETQLKDKRHGKTPQQISKEKSKVKKAFKLGRVTKSKVSNSSVFLGATRDFNVLVADNKIDKRKAILHKISKTALFWLDKNVEGKIDEVALAKSIKYWEEKAFPIVTSKFGNAPMPPNDIDGEPKINLFLTPLEEGLYGYFYSADVIPEDSPESNKADMLYINSNIFDPNNPNENNANSTLIHEFQHMVNFNNKVTQRINNKKEPIYEDAWLDEGMSTYAEQLGGYGLPYNDEFSAAYLNKYFKNPSNIQIVTNGDINYGTSLLFVLYLVEQYGVDVLKKLTTSNKFGIENVELITGKPFKDTFNDWATALLLSGSKKYTKYDFKSVNLHKAYGKYVLDGINLNNIVNKYPQKVGFNMYNWTANYIKLDNLSRNDLNMNIKHNGKGSLTTTFVKLK